MQKIKNEPSNGAQTTLMPQWNQLLLVCGLKVFVKMKKRPNKIASYSNAHNHENNSAFLLYLQLKFTHLQIL